MPSRASPGIGLTVLAKPGDVRVILLDEGAGAHGISQAADAVAAQIGPACYSTTGESLAEAVVRAAVSAGATVCTAESCTGGMVSAALTDIPGSSAMLLGGVVAYANSAKIDLLDVPPGLLAQYGAVSEETARAMAEGARERFGADLAVAITGVAGPRRRYGREAGGTGLVRAGVRRVHSGHEPTDAWRRPGGGS